MSSSMASDAIAVIIEQVDKIPRSVKEIDLLIISNGGDPITAWQIMTILRERFDKVSVIIPYTAFSAATILALGADEIVMHPYSNLGPVDPQLTIIKPNAFGQPTTLQFSSEDIRNYIEFIRSDVGITDQAQLASAFSPLAADVGPIPIGNAKRSQQLSISLSTKMLEFHLPNKCEEDKEKVANIAKMLNSSYYHHGYTLNRKEAKEIGLNVKFPDKKHEEIIWSIWLDFCYEMKCNTAFDPIYEIINDPTAKQLLSQIPVISMPVNIPDQMAQNIYAQLAQQYTQVTQQSPIEIVLPIAATESINAASVCNIKASILYWRNPNMTLSYNLTTYSNGWENVSI